MYTFLLAQVGWGFVVQCGVHCRCVCMFVLRCVCVWGGVTGIPQPEAPHIK